MLDNGSGLVGPPPKPSQRKQQSTAEAIRKSAETLNRAAQGAGRASYGSPDKEIPSSSGRTDGNYGIPDYDQSALDSFIKSTAKNGKKVVHEQSQRIISQFARVADVMVTDASNSRYVELDKRKLANIIGKDQLLQIVGLPPISDNIVDPPPIWQNDEINGGQMTWGSAGLVGQEYIERVLMRGQFLVLVPLEFKPNFTRALISSIGLDESRSSELSEFFENTATRFETFLDRIDTRLNIASYGYTALINHYRYWISVGAHMKVVLHTLGIDPMDQTLSATGFSADYHNFLKERLPDFMVDRVFSHGNWKGINGLLGAGGDDSKVADELTADAKKQEDQLRQDISDINSAMSSLRPKSEADIMAMDGTNAISAGDGFISKGADRSKIGNFAKGKSGYGLGNYGFGSDAEEESDLHTTLMQDVPITLYNNSYANILNAVTNIDIRNNSLMNLPFITFYCNGNIDRNLQFSLEADKSIIAETTTDVGARTLPNLIKGVASAVAEDVTGTNSSTGGQVAAAGANAVGGSVDSATEILREIAYHNDGNFASTFVTNTYIPKVMRGGSTNVSYNVPLRFVAAGSDKYSIAQMFWGLCLLLPFVVQVSKPRMPLIIPQAAMYCAAFSKGVMNVPRGYISSMSISTDPAFQTTNGIPLELNINLTIESLYTLTTMPNFTESYGGGSDMNLITAMWHPMSSFNVVATLTGTNTVLNHTPSNIFKYFIERPVADAFVAFKTIFQTSGGYFGTQFKQWRIQLDSGDNMQYI